MRQRLSARTRAIVAVHLFGMPAPLCALLSFGVPVVEDCAHGIGGHSDAGPFGSAGMLSFSSFYATKMIGAGEGGIIPTGAVIANAVASALRALGAQTNTLPLGPPQVWEMIQRSRASSASA